jgi:competence protein ComEA
MLQLSNRKPKTENRKPPCFSRAQYGVLLLLAGFLTLLWAWRDNFFRPPAPPAAAVLNQVFIEVAGQAGNPGVFSFPIPPTLSELWHAALISLPAPDPARRLASGDRVEMAADGAFTVGRMSGRHLAALRLLIDLNTASAPDLEALPGIGPVMARRIIEFRQTHGPFQEIDDLLQVSGIGPKKLANIKHLVTLTLTPPESLEP